MDRFAKVENDATGEKSVEELVIEAFSRCSNYPKERVGVLGLAQGLAKAARVTGVSARAIVERCAEISQWCPTDMDLMNVARELQPVAERTEHPSKCPYGQLCDGQGWRISFWLWTWHSGETSWIEKTEITEEAFNELRSKVDRNAKAPLLPQEVYSAARRCPCNPIKEQAA